MNVNPFSVIAQKEKVYNASSADLSTLLPEGVSAILISSGTSITDYYTSQTVTLSGNMRGYAVRNGNNIVGWVANYDLTSEYYIGCNLSLHTTWDCIQKNALTSDLGVTYSKSVSNMSINSAVGNLFEGVVAVPTDTSGVGKRVVATFVPTSSFAFAVVRSVTASEVNISLEKGNSGTVSGTIYVTIYP